jgi:hypothetical protein
MKRQSRVRVYNHVRESVPVPPDSDEDEDWVWCGGRGRVDIESRSLDVLGAVSGRG